MKTKIISILALTTSMSVFAAQGIISVKKTNDHEGSLDLMIQGKAAKTLSTHLKENGARSFRDGFSGALIQDGKGIRCIEKPGKKPLYCTMSITGTDVNL